jgi:hypothetical protein
LEDGLDPVTLAYYGLICGALSFVAPRWRKPGLRFLVGILVGLVAAGLLPTIRQSLLAG